MKRNPLLALTLCISGCTGSDVNTVEAEGPVEVDSDWFKVTSLASNTFILEEPNSSQGNVSYLLVGEERAVLFDTGSGENDAVDGYKIKSVLEALTDIPITLLLSHLHFDHVLNISEFEVVAFPDLPLLRQRVSPEGALTLSEEDLFVGEDPIHVLVSEWLPLDRDIDLGGRTIRLVNIPGHTDESIAIIDETNEEAYLGDFLYNGPLFLFDDDDVSLYEESAKNLLSSLGPGYRLFGAHGDPEIGYERIHDLLDLLAGVQDGSYPPLEGIVWGSPVSRHESSAMSLIIFQGGV